jgi:hypothetical protein
MRTISETKAVDFVGTSLIDSKLRLVGDDSCLFDLGAVKLKINCKALTSELFKL